MKQVIDSKPQRSINPAPALLPLHHALATAENNQDRHEAALKIMNAYYSYFGETDVCSSLQKLYAAATSISNATPESLLASKQHEYFYLFSNLFLQAGVVINKINTARPMKVAK